MIGANLGSDVQDRVDAYRDNPAALQQRYMQSQELIDLLALQKMKSTQQNFARDMQLKMQSNPKTIKQQLEAEMMGRTKDDMLKGVAGVLKNKQNQAQSNINKVAARGVAGQQAPNMLKLAEGGIIGFARGGGAKKTVTTDMVTQEMIDKYKERQRKRGRRGNLNLSDDEIKQRIVDQENSFLGSDYFDNRPESKGGQMSRKRKPVEEAEEDKKVDTGIAQLQPKVDVGLQEALRKQNIKPPVVDAKPPVTQVDNFAQDKSAGIPAATSTFDAGKFAMDDAFNKQVKGGISDLINQDPQKAVDFAARTPAEQAFIDKMLKERTDMRANMMDPDRLQTDRLLQTLLGARGATPGEAFRTSGIAGINAQRAQEKLRRSEFDALNKLFMDEANRTQTLKKAAFQDALGAKKQGVASGTSLTASEKTGALEADKLVAQISNNAVTATLKKDLNDINERRNEILATGNIITGNTKMVQLYENAEAKGIKSLRDAATKEKASNFGSDKAAKDKLIDDKLAADIKKLQDSIKLKAKPFRDALKTATTGASNRAGGISETQKKADAIINN